MRTGKFLERLLLILVVILGTLLLVGGVMSVIRAEYGSIAQITEWEQ